MSFFSCSVWVTDSNSDSDSDSILTHYCFFMSCSDHSWALLLSLRLLSAPVTRSNQGNNSSCSSASFRYPLLLFHDHLQRQSCPESSLLSYLSNSQVLFCPLPLAVATLTYLLFALLILIAAILGPRILWVSFVNMRFSSYIKLDLFLEANNFLFLLLSGSWFQC